MSSIFQADVMRRGACDASRSDGTWTWYLKATEVCLEIGEIKRVYSPGLLAASVGVKNAGLRATFSREEKFSRRMVSEVREEL